ncbi:HEPN domain-containing protein [Mucilaginibacter glaciei]|uniref:RiboL-PSP-HEPN domain-containing protein n=1 Tax=Mucilaginibacter glaciei TaxID=2772109 RepID=A0A926NUQ5_9SPHI|nr:HEPN domain-containing protein [Mucilaginibacter glaciei]MBD1394942.1 hypothetical protein [Mucilaginibacter glaciei]
MTELSELKNHCYRLYRGFLKPYIQSTTLLPTAQEEDSVKAFCVLAHAAFEEYFEKLTIKTIENSYKKYKTKAFVTSIPSTQAEVDQFNDNISQLLKTLILANAFTIFSNSNSDTLKTHKSKLELASQLQKNGIDLTLENISELTKKTDSYTKEILKEVVRFFRGNIEANHGASLKYLLKLLIPVGIDIPQDLSLLNSLQKVAKYRGTYAHTKGDVTVILSASDIVKYVADAFELCKLIDGSINKFQSYIA